MVSCSTLAEWLCEAWSDQIRGWHKFAMRASQRLCLTIAKLMKANRCLWNPENLSDPEAHQPVVMAFECKVYEPVAQVNPK